MNPSTAPKLVPSVSPSDLDVLRRTEPSRSRTPRQRSWLPRLTATLIVLGLLGVAWAVVEPLLFPPRVVRLAFVRTGQAQGALRGTVTEAAGWIEADPFPVTVRPLVSGVVETLNVLEGQHVTEGETVIATLRNVDLENALDVARAELALRASELAVAEAHLETDRLLLEQRLDLRETKARFEGELEAAAAAREAAKAEQAQAARALETSQLDLEAMQDLEGAGSAAPLARRRAAARVSEAEAALTTSGHAEARAAAEVARLTHLVALAREGLDDPRALAGRVREDESQVARARAARDLAQVALDVARRNVDLLTVRAPMDGIVLRLEAAPGSRAGPEGQMRASSEEGTGSTGRLDAMSGGLVSLYHPERLQVRVDVQLGDVGGVGAGTEAEIELEALSGRTFHGEVTRLQHEADLLKNTLQVKVRILDPDPLLRPEMLGRVRFLASAPTDEERPVEVRAFVPVEALRGDAVFIYDPRGGGRARRLSVKVLSRDGALAEVEGALGAGHKVILDTVEDGERVRGEL